MDARQNIRYDLPFGLRALQAAVVKTDTNCASLHVAATGGASVPASRLVSCLARASSALKIFALNGVALKSGSKRTRYARNSDTMGLA